MAKKLLIDLEKLRENSPGESSDKLRPDGIVSSYPNSNGRKTLRELAIFRHTCRRCEDAPCVSSCPSDALDKDDEGLIRRSTNLCIACKSCVVICPFGTMMTDFFEHHRTEGNYFNINDPEEAEKFIENSPEGAAKWVEMEEDPSKNIYQLNELVLVRERDWKSIRGAGSAE